MSESAEFVLKLTDQVSGPAKQAAASLRRVEERAQAAQQKGLDRFASAWDKIGRAADFAAIKQQRALGAAFSKIAIAAESAGIKQKAAFSGAWAKIGAAAARDQEKAVVAQARAHDKAAMAARRMGLMQLQAAKMNEDFDKRKTFLGGLKAALPFRSVSDYAQGAFFGELAANAAMKIGGAFIDGAKAAVGFVTDGIKMAFVEGGKAENLRLSYKLLLGANGGAAALNDISGFAGRTKYDDDKIAEMMRPLFNAGLRGKAARSAFAASGDLEAAGLGPAQEFIEQFAKIQLKGGVSEKLLIGMGVNIRDFKAALAEETHTKDKEEAFKKASEGKSDPQAIMNAIFRGIEKRQGGQIGTGTEAAGKTMSARLEKLADLPSQYLKKMSESPEWNRLSNKLGDVLKGLDPDSPRGQKIIASLFAVFNRLATWISTTLTPENFDKFANGAAAAIDVIGRIPEILESVYRISRDVFLIWTGVKLVTGVSGFVTALTSALGATSAVGAVAAGAGGVSSTAAVFSGIASAAGAAIVPLAAVAAALGSVYLAYKAISGAIDDLGGWDKVKDDWKQFDFGKMSDNTDAEFEFDRKYSGKGAPLKPATPGQLAASQRTGVVLQFGDVNMTPAPGATAKETADEFAKRTKVNFDKAMELASAHGGG